MDTVKKKEKIITEISISSSTKLELWLLQNYTKFWKCESEDI